MKYVQTFSFQARDPPLQPTLMDLFTFVTKALQFNTPNKIGQVRLQLFKLIKLHSVREIILCVYNYIQWVK